MLTSGPIAFKIADKTTCNDGTPETSLSGRSTLKALIIFRSKPTPSLDTNKVNKPVETTIKSIIFHILCKYAPSCNNKPEAIILKNDSVQNIAKK
jgi:hypothetical protein